MISLFAETAVVSDGTILSGVAVLISVLVSGFGLYRSYKQDQHKQRKEDRDSIIENYRVLYAESQEEKKRLMKLVDSGEKLISELRASVNRLTDDNDKLLQKVDALEQEVARLRSELETERAKNA